MRFLDRIRQSLSRSLYGRYGSDQLSRVILYVSIALLFLSYATGIGLLMTLSFAGYIWAIFRIFSKNKEARARENMLYLQKTEKLRTEIRQARVRFRNRKQYKYFKCPQCRARLRLTRGCGEKTVTCQRCGHKFTMHA